MIPDDWLGGEVAVLGLGRSGTSAARWLTTHGVSVYASDFRDEASLRSTADRLSAHHVSVELGGHDHQRIKRARAVVVSPGIPPDAAPLQVAKDAGIEILAEVELALRNMPRTSFVVVTGTNGKTTTTALIEHILKAAGLNALAAGNIGRPLTDLIDLSPAVDWCVLEISSFQLHDAPSVAPAVGVLTNLAPDHQNRYESVQAYHADKKFLFRNAGPASRWVLNGDDDGVLELARGVDGELRLFSTEAETDAWFDRSEDMLKLRGEELLSRNRVALVGDHNVANVLAAALAARAVGVEAEMIADALTTFAAVAHRLQPVGESSGVRWINDSKATNVASAAAALDAMFGSYVWLVGGEDKGEDFASLASHLEGCRTIVAFGQAGPRIAASFDDLDVLVVTDLAEAVVAARDSAEPGDLGLLAPACASFDQFDNFEQRGDAFRRLVSS